MVHGFRYTRDTDATTALSMHLSQTEQQAKMAVLTEESAEDLLYALTFLPKVFERRLKTARSPVRRDTSKDLRSNCLGATSCIEM